MPKRQREERYDYTKRYKKRRAVASGSHGAIATYQTVPRTRGVYARGEMKYYDNSRNAAIAAGTDWTASELDPSTELSLFNPASGPAINQRIGQKVMVRKIAIKGTIVTGAQVDQTDADIYPHIRFALVQDTQTNGAQMQGEEVFASHQANAYTVMGAFQNINNFGRFKVLKEKIVRVPMIPAIYDGTNIEQAGCTIPFKMTYTFKKPVWVKFNSTNGGTIADIVDNSFHLIGRYSSTDTTCSLYYNVRTYYTE